MKKLLSILAVAAVFLVLVTAGCISTDDTQQGSEKKMITITDATGREVTIPENPEKIAVVGSGSMRYLVYLDVDIDKIVAVDRLDSHLQNIESDVRPYMLAHPEINEIQEVGPAKGEVDHEKLMASGAEILFMGGRTATNTVNADEIQEKTGIPVVIFYVGNYVTDSADIQDTFRMLGGILDREERAEELIDYLDSVEADLKKRVSGLSTEKTAYVGGLSSNGAHGLDGTDPTYYPFAILNVKNAAEEAANTQAVQKGYAQVSKEDIIKWDADVIFADLGTLSAAGGGAIEELKNDPAYSGMTAVKNGEVYTVNPHRSMSDNHETTLVNCYYIGKIFYPEQFADVDIAKKADEIYTAVVGAPVYEELKSHVQGLSYQKVSL